MGFFADWKENRKRKKQDLVLSKLESLMASELAEGSKIMELIQKMRANPSKRDFLMPTLRRELQSFEDLEAAIEGLDKKELRVLGLK